MEFYTILCARLSIHPFREHRNARPALVSTATMSS
jgi:hypothetical protein